MVIGALSCFFVIWDCVQVFVGYKPGLLFVRILNPVPHMSWLVGVWKTVIRLPMFPVYASINPQAGERHGKHERAENKLTDVI